MGEVMYEAREWLKKDSRNQLARPGLWDSDFVQTIYDYGATKVEVVLADKGESSAHTLIVTLPNDNVLKLNVLVAIANVRADSVELHRAKGNEKDTVKVWWL